MRRILWFRRDLRVIDNPLLSFEGDALPIFIFDPYILDLLPPNDRRVTFIFNALTHLRIALKERGLNLALFYGKPTDVFKWLLKTGSYTEVCASGDYDKYAQERDRDISHLIEFHTLQDTYIFHPDEVLKNDGTPYLVFTPFYNRSKLHFRSEHMAEYSLAAQRLIDFDYDTLYHVSDEEHTPLDIALESINFIPQTLSSLYLTSPQEKLAQFTMDLTLYPKNRDIMALHATSGISSDLRFGTISIREILRWLTQQKSLGIDTEPFFRQLIFRDFYAMLLYHFPHLSSQNFRYPFKGIENESYFEAFCAARTGVPIVDAGIRELLETGNMHNRVRMICASFFTKNLLLPWQWGEQFFAAHLMDYDAASNILSWQWSAGTGVDPQPYFRIFNPYAQTERFDKEGTYIKKYLPALKAIPAKILHVEQALKENTFNHYPHPIVDHKISSKKALEYFSKIN